MSTCGNRLLYTTRRCTKAVGHYSEPHSDGEFYWPGALEGTVSPEEIKQAILQVCSEHTEAGEKLAGIKERVIIARNLLRTTLGADHRDRDDLDQARAVLDQLIVGLA